MHTFLFTYWCIILPEYIFLHLCWSAYLEFPTYKNHCSCMGLESCWMCIPTSKRQLQTSRIKGWIWYELIMTLTDILLEGVTKTFSDIHKDIHNDNVAHYMCTFTFSTQARRTYFARAKCLIIKGTLTTSLLAFKIFDGSKKEDFLVQLCWITCSWSHIALCELCMRMFHATIPKLLQPICK